MRAPDFWARDGLAARLLEPLGRAYGLGGRLRRRLAHPFRAPVPVVCIGNLTVGGTGKTPTAIAVARLVIGRGHRPHFLTRGYGGSARGPLRVAPSDHDAVKVGDEPLLLAEIAPTWVARDRTAGARAAVAAGADLLIMDDGFQNPDLVKDLSLLVVDTENGFGNGRVLPAGPLREPVADGLARAHALVCIGRAAPAWARHCTIACIRADLQPSADAPDFRGRRVVAFAGIGRPEKFFRSLAERGAELVMTRAFPDHHPYRRAEIEHLAKIAERRNAALVTTTKDLVRVAQDLRKRIDVLPVTVIWHDLCKIERLLEARLRAHATSP